MPIEIFEDHVWQMSLGERAAVEGVLSQLRPALAAEIGSMEGACLRRIAAHAGEAHSFDLSPPTLPVPENVTVHTGDSHELLAPWLAELEEQGRNLDFVMVDGDHTPGGVRQDLEDLLNSRALAHSVILIHDTANERVRQGIDAVRFSAWPKVAHVELDWIPGQLFAELELRNELWYGIGLVIVDASRLAYLNGSVYERRYHTAAPLLADVRELVIARERVESEPASARDEVTVLRKRVAELELQLSSAQAREAAQQQELAAREAAQQQELAAREAAQQQELATLRGSVERAYGTLHDVTSSPSWKMTAPLRAAKHAARRIRRV